MVLRADDETPDVAQPCEAPRDVPSAPRTAQQTHIVRRRPLAMAPVRRDHRAAQRAQRHSERISVVGAVANELPGHRVDDGGVERGRNAGHLRAGDAEVKPRRPRQREDDLSGLRVPCDAQELRPCASLRLSHTPAPLFAATTVPSMKHAERSHLPRSFKSRASASSMRSEVPSRTRALEAAVAGLVRRVPLREVGPLRPGAHDPQDAARTPRSCFATDAPPICSSRPVATEQFEHLPLLIRQVHGCCILPRDAAYHSFMR